MIYEETNNKVVLSGRVESEPVYSHEVYGEEFYEFTLCVLRLSGQLDYIPITASIRLLDEVGVEKDSEITVYGQFRSYNKQEEQKSKLMLTVFARNITVFDSGINSNSIELTGFICKEPMYRVTPFKREICDVLIAVNRAYNKSDYIPCIAWGRNARFVSTLSIGDKITVMGRIQSREYQKVQDDNSVEVKVAYEVSISGLKTNNEVLHEEKDAI